MIHWQTIKADQIISQLEADELLLVLTRPGTQGVSPWLKPWIEKRYPTLDVTHHYLKLSGGYFGEQGAKPYLIAQWDQADPNPMERRWVASEMAKRIRSNYAVKKISVLLPDQCNANDIAIAEDLFTAQADPFYVENKWERFRILHGSAEQLKSVDPWGSDRFAGNLGFRQWINENPDQMTSLEMSRRLEEFAKGHQCQFHVLTETELKDQNMNLLLAVGQAAKRSPPRCIVVSHNWNKGGEAPLLLIGKGITFDTGGINVKPFESFVNAMKNDMGGAALTAHLFMTLVKTGYPRPLALVIPTTENLVGENAMKPGTVVKNRAGKKVFIEHTDAEGRLILSDAISYGQDYFNPRLTLVGATLTTASLRQFTGYYTPVHFANDGFQSSLQAAGRTWGENFSFWGDFLPFKVANHTKAAELTNMGRLPSHANMGGGCNIAAHFLREHTNGPLIHVDIFASTWNWSDDYPGCSHGATGAPFNSLFHAIRQEKDLWGY